MPLNNVASPATVTLAMSYSKRHFMAIPINITANNTIDIANAGYYVTSLKVSTLTLNSFDISFVDTNARTIGYISLGQ